MMINIKTLESIEFLIQRGELAKARIQLTDINPKNVAGFDLVYYCSLLRRAGLSNHAIRILQPLVYPKSRSAYRATVEEKLEYASNLVRLEILSEANRILLSIDENQFPIVLIRRGFLLTAKWDYESSNQLFQKYIDHAQANSYQVLIAKVNLLQGLVNLEECTRAWQLIDELISDLNPEKHQFLLAAVHEFSAELFRLQKDYDKGFDEIKKGRHYLRDEHSVDAYLLRKQKALLSAYAKRSVEDLLPLRQEAVSKNHHESLRDLDLHIAVLSRDEKLINEVYWKTQSLAYREKVLKYAARNKLKINTEFFQFKKNKGVIFNFTNHDLQGSLISLKKDQALGKLLAALLSEAYKPLKLLDLFSAVYESEIFFPGSSTDKVHQLLKRLRIFLKANALPLEIQCRNRAYSLVTKGNFSLSRSQKTKTAFEQKFFREMNYRYFDVTTAKEFWQCSLRTTLRRIENLKANGHLETVGKTRATRFRFRHEKKSPG